MGENKKYTVVVNGKEQSGTGAAVLAEIIASPFATDTAAIISAVSRNKKFLVALKKAESIVYEDNAKKIETTGQALVEILPSLVEYHKKATELAAMRKELNSFRDVVWKKKRGRKGDTPAEIEIDLDI